MDKFYNLFKSHRHVITWTGIYIFLMWAILDGLFNFDMFSSVHWTKMLTVELHGFPGLVLGLLILAAIPLYIATTVVTARNKTMPIKIPMPKCFLPEPKPAPSPEPVNETPSPELEPLPIGVPLEMRDKFIRARQNINNMPRQHSVFNRPAMIKTPVVEMVKNSEPDVTESNTNTNNTTGDFDTADSDNALPLPSDFEFQDQNDTPIPMFQDINFDDDFDSVDDDDTDGEKSDLFEYIHTLNTDATKHGELIFTGDYAIAVHDDDDFWVADEIDWFASGKQKPSPIAELTAAASEQNKKPILYLGKKNIMNVDKLIPEWESAGIQIVTDLSELTDIVTG